MKAAHPFSIEKTTTQRAIRKRSNMKDLQPKVVQEGCTEYVESRKDELAPSSERNIKSRLRKVVAWADEQGIDTLDKIGRKDLFDPEGHEDIAGYLKDEGLAKSTRNNHLCTVRGFLRWGERAGYVQMGSSGIIKPPKLKDNEGVRDTFIEAERAKEIRKHLRKYKHATAEHALYSLLWRTGMRIGAAHSLDLSDWYPRDRYVLIEHRPNQGTTLKNGKGGERTIRIFDDNLADALDEYIAVNRPDVTDDHGREPLFATKHGRMHGSTLQSKVYGVTSCRYVGDCSEGDACPAYNIEHASKCELSVSPHAMRRSAVTHQLNQDVEQSVLSGRVDMSTDTMDKHYDERRHTKKMNQRAEGLSGLMND
ncbi:tyrosine-type recombinase/integrase [Halococcus sp. IIIV-5B]|uniref:tyrosine-type recombinase/integrase n=1 Tax=Halococcus sp. IIIV-5B TaxID=2321230 RepID=UPI001313E012|nr:tyrosine-type recombinase/integrase [Halococcus sp. IIIV-5B]